MNSFKHSGTIGDIIYSLPIIKHFGGGELYLHLNQIDWIAEYYYHSRPPEIHSGKMGLSDFEFIKSLISQQPYITKFDTLAPHTDITHNLDKFRPLFVTHPGNYIDVYANAFGISDPIIKEQLRDTPWLAVEPTIIPGKKYVINRTLRYIPPTVSTWWEQWKLDGKEDESVFVGFPDEYNVFRAMTGWNIDYLPVQSLEQLAKLIAGSECFIGNQSSALSIAVGLGKDFACEYRRDIPLGNNECYFPRNNSFYF